MTEIAFVVEGNPIPKARPITRFKDDEPVRTFTPKRTADWEAQVAWAARAAMRDREPFQSPVGLEVRAYRATLRRADVDNLAKSVVDAIQASQDSPGGIVFLDDDQVVEAHIYKAIDREHPRVEVRVWEIEEELTNG